MNKLTIPNKPSEFQLLNSKLFIIKLKASAQNMGNCCIQSPQNLKRRTFEKAYNVFNKIALAQKKIINRQAIQEYFSSYSQSCYDVLMREVDFNKDGIITQNQWMTYWEFIRIVGYDLGKINRQLTKIQKGEVSLNFPKAKYFEPNQPRTTLMNSIMSDMKGDASTLSFLQNIEQPQKKVQNSQVKLQTIN